MEFKSIALEEIKEYCSTRNNIILEQCELEGCESLEQIESILNKVGFFDIETTERSINGEQQILDVHQITRGDEEVHDTLFTLKPGAFITTNKRLFTLMTGMNITPSFMYLVKYNRK